MTVEVGPIDDGDFKEFIAAKFKAGKRKIADGFLDAVLERANRTTGDVQELCDSIWCTGEAGETLDESAIKRGMEDVFARESRGFEDQCEKLTRFQFKAMVSLAKWGGRQFFSSDGERDSLQVAGRSRRGPDAPQRRVRGGEAERGLRHRREGRGQVPLSSRLDPAGVIRGCWALRWLSVALTLSSKIWYIIFRQISRKVAMPIIKPISDLRNYPDVLRNVEVGSPVYLTKNGTGRYVLMDIGDFGRMEGAMRLSYELQRGKRSGETQGWISATEMERHFKGRCRV